MAEELWELPKVTWLGITKFGLEMKQQNFRNMSVLYSSK
jgi:hypothetical protein